MKYVLYFICLLLPLWKCTIAASEDLYVITSPEVSSSKTSPSYIYRIRNGTTELIKTIDVHSLLCGMLMENDLKVLYIFGDSTGNGESGYVTRISLDREFHSDTLLLPVSPIFKMNLDITRDINHVYYWDELKNGKGYQLYDADISNGRVTVAEPDKATELHCYAQSGQFSSSLRVSVASNGTIVYYNGRQEFPSGFILPEVLLDKIPTSVGHYDYNCFINNDRWFGFKAMDWKSDTVSIFMFNKTEKNWKSTIRNGAGSRFWANAAGFTTCSVLTASDKSKSQSKEIVFSNYDLTKSYEFTLPKPGEVIYCNETEIAFHVQDSIYLGKFVAGNGPIPVVLFTQSEELQNACSAFKMSVH